MLLPQPLKLVLLPVVLLHLHHDPRLLNPERMQDPSLVVTQSPNLAVVQQFFQGSVSERYYQDIVHSEGREKPEGVVHKRWLRKRILHL